MLLIDDLAPVRVALTRLLSSRYDVTSVGSVAEAIALLHAGERFEVAVVDLDMPDTDGWTGILTIREIDPALGARSLIFTGALPSHPKLVAALDAGCRVLHKPATRVELEEAIESARTMVIDLPRPPLSARRS